VKQHTIGGLIVQVPVVGSLVVHQRLAEVLEGGEVGVGQGSCGGVSREEKTVLHTVDVLDVARDIAVLVNEGVGLVGDVVEDLSDQSLRQR
jgi:hypothetical protein